jgi:hypothetical protein
VSLFARVTSVGKHSTLLALHHTALAPMRGSHCRQQILTDEVGYSRLLRRTPAIQRDVANHSCPHTGCLLLASLFLL